MSPAASRYGLILIAVILVFLFVVIDMTSLHISVPSRPSRRHLEDGCSFEYESIRC